MSRFLLSLGLLVFLCSPALAGQLFPPDNSATPGACVDGKVLKWTGDSVTCVDPLNKATITCPAGQVMKGVVNGVPDCVASGGGGGLYKSKVKCFPGAPGVGFGGCWPATTCVNANPLTGGCSCPAGFSERIIGTPYTIWPTGSGMSEKYSEYICVYCGGPCP